MKLPVICINADPSSSVVDSIGLVLRKRYTAAAILINAQGDLCYRLKELSADSIAGNVFPTSRFSDARKARAFAEGPMKVLEMCV